MHRTQQNGNIEHPRNVTVVADFGGEGYAGLDNRHRWARLYGIFRLHGDRRQRAPPGDGANTGATGAVPRRSSGPRSAAAERGQLEQLVAPIALYPDPLLAQILMAATYPLEVVEAARWVKTPANRKLTGDALANALQAENWDPSIKALVPFPRVLENMSVQLQWTEQLGNAFLAQQAEVMAAVQSLRHEAMAAGNLKQTPQCRCVIQTSGETIAILPAEPQVACVPVYSPAAYGEWRYPAYPPYAFPAPAGFAYEPGFWIGFGPPIVLAAFGPLWGWGSADWGHRGIAVDPGRYALAAGGRASFAGSVWVHDPGHRRGVGYADAATRARFDAARVSAVTAAARSGAGRGARGPRGSGGPASEAAHGAAGRFGGAAAVRAGGAGFHNRAASNSGEAFHGGPAAHSRAAFRAGPTAFHGGGSHGGGGPHFAMGGSARRGWPARRGRPARRRRPAWRRAAWRRERRAPRLSRRAGQSWSGGIAQRVIRRD